MKTPLDQIKEHEEENCEFRQVLCPGNDCNQRFAFNTTSNHAAKCQHCIWPPRVLSHNNNYSFRSSFTVSQQSANNSYNSWKTITIKHFFFFCDRLLFLKRYLKNSTYYFDIVMAGKKKDSQKLRVSVSINDPKCGKPVYKASLHPRY